MIFVGLVADFGDLSPYLVWTRLSLLLAGDVETNPGPGYFCAELQPEQFPMTDKNVGSYYNFIKCYNACIYAHFIMQAALSCHVSSSS